MQGLAIGLIFGAAALYFLARASKAITSGNVHSALLPFFGNFACVLAAMALGVLFFRDQLMYLGCGLAAALAGGAFAWFALRGGRK